MSYRNSTLFVTLYRPCTTDLWITSSGPRLPRLCHCYHSKSLRTMKDPVQRTASPYVDPSIKGPRSQQLSAQTHSTLYDHKSECLCPPAPCLELY